MEDQTRGQPDDRVQAFLDMLQQQPTAADCRVCLAQLPDYIPAQNDPATDLAQFAWIRRHLDSCVACAQSYAQLYELLLADNQNALRQPATIPAPDLSFLTAVPSLPRLLENAWRRTGQQLTLQLSESLNNLLAPPPQPALRSAGDDRYFPPLLKLTPEQLPQTAVPLTLTAYTDQAQPGYCLVELTVEPPGRSWPDLAGNEVTLTADDRTRRAVTDEWGTAVFADWPILDLDGLRIDITLTPPPA